MLHNMNNKRNAGKAAMIVGSTLAGVVIGSTAVLLSDKKNQEKFKKTLSEVSKKASSLGKTISKKADEYTDDIEKQLKKTEESTQQIKKDVEQSAEKIKEDAKGMVS